MKRATPVVVACILLSGCGSPPSTPIDDGQGHGVGILQLKGMVPWKCINKQGETVYNDSTISLHPTKPITVTSVELMDPTDVTLAGAYLYPYTLGTGIQHPGLGRGWPGDPLTDQQRAQNWATLPTAAGQTLPPATPTRGTSLALKVTPTAPKWEYKGVIINFTSDGKSYTKRIWAGLRGAPKCADFPPDIDGDKKKYG